MASSAKIKRRVLIELALVQFLLRNDDQSALYYASDEMCKLAEVNPKSEDIGSRIKALCAGIKKRLPSVTEMEKQTAQIVLRSFVRVEQ
jgi:hypothetical protein